MTSPNPAAVAPSAAAETALVCCRRPMSSIEVTTPLGGGKTLALHTCSACGRHLWVREDEVLDRGAVLGIVRERIAEGPAPRVPRQRKSRAQQPAVPAQMSSVDVRERLAGFTVHGS